MESKRQSTPEANSRSTPEADPRAPIAGPVVRQVTLRGVGLAAIAGVVTFLCASALTRGRAAIDGSASALLGAVMVVYTTVALLCHMGHFKRILAYDRERAKGVVSPETLHTAFTEVANAPRYWFVRAFLWFTFAGLTLAGSQHWLWPEAFPIQLVMGRTTSSVAGAFLFAVILYFYLKDRFVPLRDHMAREIGDPDLARSMIVPVPLKVKVVVGVTGALMVASLYGAVLGQVRATRTAEAEAVRLGNALIDQLVEGIPDYEVRDQARKLGLAEEVLIFAEAELEEEVRGHLADFELEALIASGAPRGDSLMIVSPHHFVWRRLIEGDMALVISPQSLYGGGVPSMVGALGVFGLVVLFITVVVAWLLARDTEQAAVRLRVELERLASGDLAAGEPVLWEDELGDLAAGVDHTADSLRAMVGEVSATADRVDGSAGHIADASRTLVDTGQGQVTGVARVKEALLTVTGQVGGIAQSARDLTDSVEEGSSSILQLRSAGQSLDEHAVMLNERVDEVSSSIDELIRSVRDVLGQAEHLSGAAVETSSSMEQMAASLREVDTNAGETARLSEEVVQAAEEGRARVRETLEGIEGIQETTETARGVIHSLGGRTKEIGAIVNVIDDVAEETNLLALNAAIIAAQAGENGRSFSVVADEIKKLADRVLSSTKEIEQVIHSVQQESGAAVGAIEEGSRKVKSGVARANQAGEALEAITSSARASGARISEIVNAVGEQTRAAGHVVELMEHVRSGVEHIRRAGQEQDRGNEAVLASSEVMRDIARQVQTTTREQAQGGSRLAEGVEAVHTAVARINQLLEGQTGACHDAESVLDEVQQTTSAHGSLAEELDQAVGHMRAEAERLRREVGRFRL